MVDHPLPSPSSIPDSELLAGDEVIVITDDFPDIVGLLQEFLQQQRFPTVTASSAEELRLQIKKHTVALVLLDIGLPDADGMDLLPELKGTDPDLAVIMLTAVTDLQTALVCLRHGADDYLTKPVHFADLLTTLRKVLEKRRLAIRNRQYQRQIEEARFRIQLAHELAMQMNTAYLTMTALDEMLYAILVGITAEEGLQYNRAFLALFDEEGKVMEGRLAIGPGSREEGGRIWEDLQRRDFGLHELIGHVREDVSGRNTEVNRIVRALRVDAADKDHLLLRSVHARRSINVREGRCEDPVPLELIGLLQEDTFVVVPLYSRSRALGVIIADHYISRKPITDERVAALESFASQASLAIEHCHLYMAMERKIRELEAVTEELQKNKDLLVEAERYSAVGHMAAQLAHSIRNPITAIGGTARLLARKTANQEWLQFLTMMTEEAEKIEKTLEDLFSFVEQVKPVCERQSLSGLIRKTLFLFFTSLQERKIRHHLLLADEDPLVDVDPRLMQQALVHLLRNSIEAMPSGGELTLEVRPKEREVAIILTDSGAGMAERDLQQATDPFFTTKIIGTGMGLTLVKRIVEDHRGTLLLERAPNWGLTATILLPRAEG